jgi:hypothetical protein
MRTACVARCIMHFAVVLHDQPFVRLGFLSLFSPLARFFYILSYVLGSSLSSQHLHLILRIYNFLQSKKNKK